jgi:competence protein ComEA
MQATPPLAAAPAPPPVQHAVLLAWPRSAQLVTAFLLGLATALLAVHSYGYLRYGTRPTEQQRATTLTYQVDLNQAEQPELLQLPGIGESLAERILDYREAHHGFRDIDELRKVRGIGPATMAKLRPWVCVSPMEEIEDYPEATADSDKRLASGSKGNRPAHKGSTSKKIANLDGPININRASLEELKRLPNIGQKRAERIIAGRRKGPFKSVEDLRRIKGFGPAILDELRPHVTFGNERVQVAAGE